MLESKNVNELYPLWLLGREKSEPLVIIDVRGLDEYQNGHVPGAKLIALNTLMARVDEIPEEGDVFLICHSGMRSAQAGTYLKRECGRNNVINVSGGTQAWINAGYPVAES
ncbi:rhodanese-like domain-containing protein [Mariprofundus sp. EBB-1]|uniref:rhodanese-like domain-containing protein n=1 Tax=Mariprofundus sp. EBB-1 TaxID=2650971 RepID=UPI000EF27A19|nr:rhodanese-like domain-containing protein [Mariprofundus sp. EBB-1]RLL54732.1 rhodanese-like domain-containing protein [Mariprofundus sp. EBB-1]